MCLNFCTFVAEQIVSLSFRFAYIEFADKESVRTAMALDESLFRGRQIKVSFSLHFSLASPDFSLKSWNLHHGCQWSVLRWALREQTDQELAPQTAVSQGLGSDHGEETSCLAHATTVATRHPEAEDGPSGELTPRRLPVGKDCTCMHQITLTGKVVTSGSPT